MSEMISQELLSWEDTEEDRLGPKWTVTGSWLLSNPCFWFRQSTLPRKREDSMATTLLPSPFLWTVSATITRDVPGLPSLHSKEDEEKSVKWRKTNKNPQTNKTPGKQTKPNQNYKTNKGKPQPTTTKKPPPQQHLHSMDPGWKSSWRTQGKTASTAIQGCLILLKRGLRSGIGQTKGIRLLITTNFFQLTLEKTCRLCARAGNQDLTTLVLSLRLRMLHF